MKITLVEKKIFVLILVSSLVTCCWLIYYFRINNHNLRYIFHKFTKKSLDTDNKSITALENLQNNINNNQNNVNDNIGNNCIECEAAITRDIFISMLPDLNFISSLEIGPFGNPVLRGEKVKYFDVLDKENLIKSAKEKKLTSFVNNVPNIDYVEPNGDLSIVKEKFDLVFSSHNIEHQVDLIKHLQQVANLLKDNGVFYLAIPDKRYCFDHYIPKSMLSDVLSVYWENHTVHSLKTILSMHCETGHNEAIRYWNGDIGKMAYENNKNCFIDAFKAYTDSKGKYIDSHKWRFTPYSFIQIINQLNKMSIQPFKIKKVFDTKQNSLEFYAILSLANHRFTQ